MNVYENAFFEKWTREDLIKHFLKAREDVQILNDEIERLRAKLAPFPPTQATVDHRTANWLMSYAATVEDVRTRERLEAIAGRFANILEPQE